MVTQIKQDTIQSVKPTAGHEYAIKEEVDNVHNAVLQEDFSQKSSTPGPAALVDNDIDIVEFDIDKALLQRERTLSVVLVRCDQVITLIVLSIMYHNNVPCSLIKCFKECFHEVKSIAM